MTWWLGGFRFVMGVAPNHPSYDFKVETTMVTTGGPK